jgi:hypothetical protein
MPDTGNLAQDYFPVLLARYFKAGVDGTLELHVGLFRKTVYLQGGRVVFAASSDRNDRLGEVLVRRDVLKIPEFLEASAAMVPGKRFGTMLVERGALSPERLVWAVKEQVKEIVFSLFDVAAGSYIFREGQTAEDEVITLNLNTPELIRQGVARMDHATWALEAFKDSGSKLELALPRDQVAAAFELGEFEQESLDQLVEPKRLSDFFNETPFPHFDLLKFLWVLYVLEMIRVLPPDTSEMPLDLDVTGEDLGQIP